MKYYYKKLSVILNLVQDLLLQMLKRVQHDRNTEVS
jgi:hypothetical protein